MMEFLLSLVKCRVDDDDDDNGDGDDDNNNDNNDRVVVSDNGENDRQYCYY